MLARAGLLVAALLAAAVAGNACLDQCDVVWPVIPNDLAAAPVTFCGTDNLDHSTARWAIVCYDTQCGVTALNAGTCDCPNNCTAGERGDCRPVPGRNARSFTVDNATTPAGLTALVMARRKAFHGVTSGTHQCACKPGWGGRDCNTVKCPTNNCSHHGTCVPAASAGNYGVDHCRCEAGWTGPDCAAPLLVESDLPWGCVLPPVHAPAVPPPDRPSPCAPQPLDQIPWFRFHQLAEVRVTMAPEEYRSLVDPANQKNEDYVKCAVSISSGGGGPAGAAQPDLLLHMPEVGIRLHGAAARIHPKKGFTLKFDKFNKTNKDIGWEKMYLKNPYGPLSAQMATTLLQTMGVPVQRQSFVLLYLNDVFAGVYITLPSFTEGFVKAWWGEKHGHFYKMGSSCWLQFEGWDDNYGCAESKWPEEANNTDFKEFLNFTNFATNEKFAKDVATVVDVETTLRLEVVSAFVLLLDSFTDNGNNFQMYRQESGQWTVFLRDFDSVYALQGDTHYNASNVFLYPTLAARRAVVKDQLNKQNPLLNRLFEFESTNVRYAHLMQMMLDAVFKRERTPADGPSLHHWYTAITAHIEPWTQRDEQWRLFPPYRWDGEDLYALSKQDVAWLGQRYFDVEDQLRAFNATTHAPAPRRP